MICYKDMTFCGSDCTNTKCSRHFDEVEHAAARKWWGGGDAPIAFADFSEKCEEYKSPE